MQVRAAKDSSVYTVARFPVAAQARDAVAAKRLAMKDGQIRAFRSLLKRIVPVAAYGRLPQLKLNYVQDMIEDFSVRNEQNSRTEYLATLEFKFRQRNIQQLLKSYGLPYVDKQAPRVLVIPYYVASWPDGVVAENGEVGDSSTGQAGSDERVLKSRRRDWLRAWRDLDLVNALVPVTLKGMHEKIHPDTIRQLIEGHEQALDIVREEYDKRNILVALAGPAKDGRMAVRLIGSDAVGSINLARNYRIYDGDFLYTAELASIVGLGVLEGRWKSIKARRIVAATPQWSAQQSLAAEVQFSGLHEWQQIRQKLINVPGIDELKIGRLSARGADISFSHPGDIENLRSTLLASGLILEEREGQYSLRSR